MELNSVWCLVAVLVGTYIFLFGILKEVNGWWYVWTFGKRRHLLPPGDMGWPFIGNMWSFIKAYRSQNPDILIYDLVARYGGTGMYKTHMFMTPCIIVSLPETCRPVLMDDEKFGIGYPKIVLQLAGRKAFHSIPSAEHRRLRKLTTSSIKGHEALSMYVGYIEKAVIDAFDKWSHMDKPFEFLFESRKVAFKVITHIFLGSSTSPAVIADLEKYYHEMLSGLSDMGLKITGFSLFEKSLKAREKLVEILQREIDKRRATKGNITEKGTLDLVMEAEDEDGKTLEDEDLTDLLVVFLLAGHESSSTGTMCSLLYLNQHPEVLRKAREEQKEMVKRRPNTQKGLTLKEIREMEFLPKVIDETLRICNPSFSLFRRAKEDVKLNGFLIPKGWRVLIWNRAVHMNPDIYANPKEFNPSRWENKKARTGSFLPFGGGSHICPGADLAKIEISIFLHYFLLNYKIEILNPESPWDYLPVPSPRDNCLVKITKLYD